VKVEKINLQENKTYPCFITFTHTFILFVLPTYNVLPYPHNPLTLELLRGQIATLDHYHPPRGKIEGTRSTPY
jgi:hypothetical protein